MARTFISAQGQNTSNLTTPGYIAPDNISTELVQFNYIIKGDGVNGEVVDTYPSYDSESNIWPQGNVSEIFTYLNPGGSNVKHTNFKYNTTFGAEQLYRNIELDIYWGKYVIVRISSGQVANNLYDISDLSGLVSAAAGAPLGAPYVLYPEINLDTREITKLPRYNIDESADHEWTIETDDFATTVSAPTPQEDVSGTKISELSSTSSLQDNDLLVISRDEGSDGSFDTSYNLEYKTISDTISSQITSQIPQVYESAETAIPATNTTEEWTHSLGQAPDLIELILRCKTAEYGYSIGDELRFTNEYTYYVGLFNFWANASTIGFRHYSVSGIAFNIVDRSVANTIRNPTQANWKIVVKGIVF